MNGEDIKVTQIYSSDVRSIIKWNKTEKSDDVQVDHGIKLKLFYHPSSPYPKIGQICENKEAW